ncbi:MAG: ATP-binding protein [Myxococcota bacterium]
MNSRIGEEAATEIGLSGLRRLRWLAVAVGTISALLATFVLDVDVSLTVILILLGAMAGSNLLLTFYSPRIPTTTLLAAVLMLDVGIVFGCLAVSGGPENPFSVAFLIYVTIAAAVLNRGFTWAIVGLSIVAYGSLFFIDSLLDPLLGGESSTGGGMHHHHHAEAGFSAHLYGMFIAFSVSAAMVALVVQRIASSLSQRRIELAKARDLAARHQRSAALSTLAAGAAHELSTPLGTIAVIAAELDRWAEQRGEAAVSDDAALIQKELRRCRAILDEMASRSGHLAGEGLEPRPVRELVEAAAKELRPDEQRRLEISGTEGSIRVPPRAFVQVLSNLIHNALDASDAQVQVEFRDDNPVTVTVRDEGVGMSPEVAERATDPFFTTKDTGAGMGLGLFVAKSVADQLGGTLRIETAPGEGTEVSLELPQ